MKEQLIKQDLMRFLNRNYYIASHLIERLDELKVSKTFYEVEESLNFTIISLELNASQIEHLFNILDDANSFEECAMMIDYMESIFTTIQKPDSNPYLSLLDYICLGDSLLKNGAELAEVSLTHLRDLHLPNYLLYNIDTLQPLKKLLEERYL